MPPTGWPSGGCATWAGCAASGWVESQPPHRPRESPGGRGFLTRMGVATPIRFRDPRAPGDSYKPARPHPQGGAQRAVNDPAVELRNERSVARRLDVVGPLLEHLGVDLLLWRAALLVELTGQRTEVRVVSAVL